MKLIKAKLASAGISGDTTILTLTAPGKFPVTMGEEITAVGFEGFDAERLNELHDYLIDRPALMDDKAVKQGVAALRCILNIK